MSLSNRWPVPLEYDLNLDEEKQSASAIVHEQPVEQDLSRLLDAVRSAPPGNRTLPRIVLLLLMLMATAAGWYVLQGWELSRKNGGLDYLSQNLNERWAQTTLRCLQPARTLCDEIESGAIRTSEQFVRSTDNLRQAHDVYEAAYWIGPDGLLKAGMTDDGVTPTGSLPFGTDAAMWKQLRSSSGGQPITGPVYEGHFGRTLVLLYFPLGDEAGGGGVAAVLRMSRMMEQFSDGELRELVCLDFVRKGQLIYRTGNYLIERDPSLRKEVKVRMLDQEWTCTVTPTSRYLRQHERQTSTIVLGVGLLGCVIAGASVLEAMKRRWQHTMLERGHVEVIDIITELSRTVWSHPGAADQSLARVVEAARPVTDADAVGVYRMTPDGRRLELICFAGSVPLVRSIELDRPSADPLRPVLEGRTLEPAADRSAMAAAFRIFGEGVLRGGAIAPLRLERVIGVMFFGSTSAEAWAEGRSALVRLWASQCAAILGDEALKEQMNGALGVQEKLAHRRESMLNVMGEIYQAATVEQTLGRIAQLSPQALGIEACVVLLRTRKEAELEVVAATGELSVRYGGVRMVMPGEEYIRIFKPESVTVLGPPEIEKAGLARITQAWLAGMAVVPMTHSDGRPIGCIALLSAGQVAFTSDQLDLARVLASRASAAIENAHLNQQIRREAETRSMLLRELNHRVKNNLAGIVGLLSMSNQMQMPANVRQWLDRVIERIGTIARAHELFSGGIQAVSMAQLVEQVIPSLAVVKPPGVQIVKDLGKDDIWLKTTQAVSLAMVIHELCYNAIVHGLGARGMLTIRCRLSDRRGVQLDIIDDGTAQMPTPLDDGEGGLATMAPPAASTGLGLRLVKGLVGRELRGRFAMQRRGEGGTVVTVEFPLERDEERQS